MLPGKDGPAVSPGSARWVNRPLLAGLLLRLNEIICAKRSAQVLTCESTSNDHSYDDDDGNDSRLLDCKCTLLSPVALASLQPSLLARLSATFRIV